jgi:MutS domain II
VRRRGGGGGGGGGGHKCRTALSGVQSFKKSQATPEAHPIGRAGGLIFDMDSWGYSSTSNHCSVELGHCLHPGDELRRLEMTELSRSRTASTTRTTTGLDYKETKTTSRPYTGRSRPRTAATSTGYNDNEIICAISESRGISPTIGLSFVNLSTSEAVLCQFADTQTYARTCHKIKVFSPSEIIFMSTAQDSKLLSIIQENVEVERNDIMMTSIDRRYWAETTGHEYLHQLAFRDDIESLKISIGGNYFAACCFAAVCEPDEGCFLTLT